MALRTYANPFVTDPELIAACQAEGVSVAVAATFLAQQKASAIRGLEAWITDPAHNGAGVEEWKAAHPRLANVSDAAVRALMRWLASRTSAIVADDGT